MIGGGGGGGVKVVLNGKFTWKHACFCAFIFEILNYTKAQKHARFHVFSRHLVPLFTPLHHNVKESILKAGKAYTTILLQANYISSLKFIIISWRPEIKN